MKKLFFILTAFIFILYLTGCPEPIPDKPTPEPTPLQTPDPIDPGCNSNILFALYDGKNLHFWDGNKLNLASTGKVVAAGKRKLAIGNALYYFNENGKSEYSIWLPTIPDAITTIENISKASTIYDDGIYVLEDIPPAEAFSLGALYRHYTRIYENSIEVGNWWEHEWEVTGAITTASGHVLAVDSFGNFHNLTDNKIVDTAYEDGIMLYDMSTQHGYIADETGEYEITWQYNFFEHSVWQEADGVWYTENGYIWTPTGGVVTNANVMYGWNSYSTYPDSYNNVVPYGEKPYIITSGVRQENGYKVTYWIETVTGYLYRHDPAINELVVEVELYEGPLTRAGAIPYYNTLTPVIVDNILYYHEGGSIMMYNFTTQSIDVFSGDQELIPW